jgi:hypothetical protein
MNIHHYQDDRLLIQALTCNITHGIRGHHKELIKIVLASSMDPRRAKHETEDKSDAMFFKFDA